MKLVPITQDVIHDAEDKEKSLKEYHAWLKRAREQDKKNLKRLERMRPNFKVKYKEYKKMYYQKPEVKVKYKEYKKMYYQKPEVKTKYKEYQKRYYQSHKEQYRARYLKRKELMNK